MPSRDSVSLRTALHVFRCEAVHAGPRAASLLTFSRKAVNLVCSLWNLFGLLESLMLSRLCPAIAASSFSSSTPNGHRRSMHWLALIISSICTPMCVVTFRYFGQLFFARNSIVVTIITLSVCSPVVVLNIACYTPIKLGKQYHFLNVSASRDVARWFYSVN